MGLKPVSVEGMTSFIVYQYNRLKGQLDHLKGKNNYKMVKPPDKFLLTQICIVNLLDWIKSIQIKNDEMAFHNYNQLLIDLKDLVCDTYSLP